MDEWFKPAAARRLAPRSSTSSPHAERVSEGEQQMLDRLRGRSHRPVISPFADDEIRDAVSSTLARGVRTGRFGTGPSIALALARAAQRWNLSATLARILELIAGGDRPDP